MNAQFNAQVALVTGAGSGIGRATVLAFAAQGARVVVADRRIESAAQTVGLIEAAGGTAHAVKVDVTQAAEVEAMVAQAVQRYGGLNFAVNNAGIEGDVRVPVAGLAGRVLHHRPCAAGGWRLSGAVMR